MSTTHMPTIEHFRLVYKTNRAKEKLQSPKAFHYLAMDNEEEASTRLDEAVNSWNTARPEDRDAVHRKVRTARRRHREVQEEVGEALAHVQSARDELNSARDDLYNYEEGLGNADLASENWEGAVLEAFEAYEQKEKLKE